MASKSCIEYIKTRAVIYFPKGEMSCRFCPLLETYSRNQCRRTGEYIVDTHGIGMYCPLEIEEVKENEDGEL